VNNLKQINLAILSYHTNYEAFPPGVSRLAGPVLSGVKNARTSWLTSILPYMEQNAIYQATNFNQTVDSFENSTSRFTRMTTLLCPAESDEHLALLFNSGTPAPPSREIGRTSYVGSQHDVEAAINVDQNGIFFLNSNLRVADVIDGLTSTILIGEVAYPSPDGWMAGTRAAMRNTGHPINGVDPRTAESLLLSKSGNLSLLDAERVIAQGNVETGQSFVGGFSSLHPFAGANFSFVDGSVRLIVKTIDGVVLQRLGHRADGEVVDDESY
jgi:prepilin-type processing-associated H-X9-DG protein